ncbi:MAG: hypothetical protein ACTSRH_02270 [Promethearchaeota archaeon]
MRQYFHCYPTCPYCHEPFVLGALLKINNNEVFCSSCNSYFKRYINLLIYDKFPKTIDIIRKSDGEPSIKYLKTIPLIWKIETNIIENEYISWIKKNPRGKFLITWPWREVKFIPLLVSEFLLEYPNKKVVIIGDISNDNIDINEIGFPKIDEIFENLIYLKNTNLKCINNEIKREMNRLNRKHIFLKKNVIHFLIKDVIKRDFKNDGILQGDFSQCKRILKREIETDFGKKAIKYIKEKRRNQSKWSEHIYNDNGFIEIRLDERTQYIGKNLRYNKKWLWTVLLNSQRIKRLKKIIVSKKLKSLENSREFKEKLFFISSEIKPDIIFKLIKPINPDLIIIKNSDEFIKDIIFNGEKSRVFINFLSKNNESTIIMFSTNPEIRYLYGINYYNPSFNSLSIYNYNILPHTWDFNLIIEKIKNEFEKKDPKHPNPVSSRFNDLPSLNKPPDFEFIRIDIIDNLEILLKKFQELFNNNIYNDIKRYICDLRKSPLLLKGDYRKPEIFSRKSRHSGQIITYHYLISLLYERVENKTTFREIINLIDEIYTIKNNVDNPIMKKICEKIRELLIGNQNYISIIVHKFDIRGTKKLLKKLGFEEFIPHRLNVCSWNSLLQEKNELPDIFDHYVISTLPPSIEYRLGYSQIKKIIFIGGRNFIDKIETILNYRLTETFSKPIFSLSDKDSAPLLLKKLLKKLNIPSNKDIQNIINDVFIEFESSNIENEYFSSIKNEDYHSSIKPNEKVLLVIDPNEKGIFIPEGATILIIESGNINEIEINFSSYSAIEKILNNAEILLNKQRLYSSFKLDFIRDMMVYGKNIIFKKGPYYWNGFNDLFQDAIQWIILIKRAINEYSYKHNISYEEAEEKISEYISSLGITARDKNYIKSWWKNYNKISTEYGDISLYGVEHPKSVIDLEKIYEGLNKILPELKIDISDARKCYAASILIQYFRRALLKGKIDKINLSLRGLYFQIAKNIQKLIEESERFKVKFLYVGKVIREVEPFKIRRDYKDFFKSIP